jgi:Icc-related predicted phosphoesterase
MEREKLKIWHISDTHTYHRLLTVPEVDMVIFTGDCSNPKNPYTNEPEVRDFLNWYRNLPIKYKIFVPGNHDTSVEEGLVSGEDFNGIICLHNEHVTIEGIKIFGSPLQPQFGTGWAFNRPRDKMDNFWSLIEEDVQIVAVHTPPKTILDAAYNPHSGVLESCGCQALKRHMLERVKPKYCLFGHIHNNKDLINAGTLKLSAYDTVFSNGSVVTDKMFGRVTSNGNILEI